MQVEDLLPLMSKISLERIVKSFTESKSYKKDEQGYLEQIRNNVDHLSKANTIKLSISKFLSNSKTPYQNALLVDFILRTLIGSQDYKLSFSDLCVKVQELEKDIIEKSSSKENFKHINDLSLTVFNVLLEAALEDERISEDELHLIQAVRRKLNLQLNDHYMIQARLNYFPQKDNAIHSEDDINFASTGLQKCGVVFYANKTPEQFFVIPEEIVDGVKSYLGIELVDEKFNDLLDILSGTELSDILARMNLRQTGKKEELTKRILITGIKPSEVLNSLSNDRLTELCKRLPDLKSSGSKDDKVKRIIKHFDDLVSIDTGDTQNMSEVFYAYYEQLAALNMSSLLGKKIISKEKEAANAFEDATRYLFENKLFHKPMLMNGTEHCDGCLKFGNKGEIMMWDNKALMDGKKYTFPNDHLRQFKKYIRDSDVREERVSCFLVIVPDIDEKAKINARKLKFESNSDTDVAIITASNLKWLAEEWASKNPDKPINLAVFNTTGILTRSDIKEMMKAVY